MAYFGGRLTRRRVLAPLVGAGLILVGLAAYAAWVHTTYGTSLYNITNDGRAASWAFLAILLGSVGGVAGAWTLVESRRQRQGAWGFAVGVPVAEAAYVLSRPGESHAAGLALCLLVTGAAVAVFAVRR